MVSFFLSFDLTLAGLVLRQIEEEINNTSTLHPEQITENQVPLSSLQRDGHPNSKRAMQKRKVKFLVSICRSN